MSSKFQVSSYLPFNKIIFCRNVTYYGSCNHLPYTAECRMFDPRTVFVGFIVDKVAWDGISILPVLNTHISLPTTDAI
jgi:hypothetical protein